MDFEVVRSFEWFVMIVGSVDIDLFWIWIWWFKMDIKGEYCGFVEDDIVYWMDFIIWYLWFLGFIVGL